MLVIRPLAGIIALVATAALLTPVFVVTAPTAAALLASTTSNLNVSPRPMVNFAPAMVAVDAADFTVEGAELPAGLIAALARDTGMSGAEYLARAAAGDAAGEVVDALSDTIDVRGSKMQGTELVVYVSDRADAALVAKAGATAVIGEPVELEPAAVLLAPAYDLRGGENHTFAGFRCTTGFVGTSAAAAIQVLTAGHCRGNPAVERTQYRYQNAPYVFSGVLTPSSATALGLPVVNSYQTGGGYDHGLIGVANAADWTPLPQITTWNYGGGWNTQDPLTIRDARAPLVGETACKSGATSGWTCGLIERVNRAVCIGGKPDDLATPLVDESRQCVEGVNGDYVLNAIVATICMLRGDSGGPVVIGTTAIGINSASSAGSSCTSDNVGAFAPLYSTGTATFSDPYDNSSAATKFPGGAWEVSVGVNAPTLTNTASGVTRFTGTTLSGTVPSGSSRHAITVDVDGTVYTPAVSSSGTWSVDVSPLTPGRYDVDLQAGWGARSLSPTATSSWLNAAMTRYAGADRYVAAANISEAQFMPGVDKVFVATGDNFPDALAAGPVAASFDAPLLLTPRSTVLPPAVRAELDRLNPSQIVVIGGTTSMPPALVSAMSVYASNPAQPTVRIDGQTRYDVSLALLEYAGFTNVNRAWVVTGNGFADALSVSAVAAAELVPVILVPGTDSSLSPKFLQAINDLNPTAISIGGGRVSVSEGIHSQLAVIAPTTRFGGADRFEASVNINNSVHTSASIAYLANGLNYPDALAGGVVAGLVGAPLFIGYPWCVPDSVVDRMVELDISQLRVLGGTASVSVAAENLTRC